MKTWFRQARTRAVFIALLAVLNPAWLSSLGIVVRSPAIHPVPLLGNHQENIRFLPSPEAPEDYAFIVVGDSKHGDKIFKTLMEKAHQVEDLKFGVHLGDFVPHSTAGEYAFLIHGFRKGPHFPLFMVPGNHDVKPDEDKGSHWFEKALGPRQTWFHFRGDLFIIADNAVRPTEEAMEWVRGVLSAQATGSRNIFLFLHRPLFDVDKLTDAYRVDPRHPFHKMLKKWNVGYVFAGHYHSYLRSDVEGIKYMVTGGGGSSLYGRRGFYHAIILNVRPSQVQESMVTTPFRFDLKDEFESFLYSIFYEFYRKQPALFVGLMIGGQLLLLWGLVHFLIKR